MAAGHSRAIARTAIAMLAEGAGFQEIQKSALEAMTDLLLQQLGDLGSASNGHANLASRTDRNINDVLMAFEDHGVSTGELQEYAEAGVDLAFLHNIAPYPIIKQPMPLPTFADKKEDPPSHVLPGMPAFPDPHTYKSTPVFEGHDTDARRQKLAATRAKTQAEKALVKLHDRMMPPPPTPSHTASQPTPGRLPPSAAAPGNPFLATPRWEDGGAALATDWEADFDTEPYRAGGAASGPGSSNALEHPEGQSGIQWTAADANVRDPAVYKSLIPGFQLDWTARMEDEAATTATHLGFEDAYEDAEDERGQDGPALKGKGSKRRRGASKAGSRRKPARRAPQTDHAEAILAAGSNALYMHDAAHGPAALETFSAVPDEPHPQVSELQPQEPQSEIF